MRSSGIDTLLVVALQLHQREWETHKKAVNPSTAFSSVSSRPVWSGPTRCRWFYQNSNGLIIKLTANKNVSRAQRCVAEPSQPGPAVLWWTFFGGNCCYGIMCEAGRWWWWWWWRWYGKKSEIAVRGAVYRGWGVLWLSIGFPGRRCDSTLSITSVARFICNSQLSTSNVEIGLFPLIN